MFRLILPIVVLAATLHSSVARAQQTTEASNAVSTQTFLDFQVQRPVRLKAPVAPAYPSHMRAAGIDGQVVAQFVVDERGFVVMSTFKVLRATNDAFADAVRRAVSEMKFFPAEAEGRKVKQLVQQPFSFASR